jgi:hypothetical protein
MLNTRKALLQKTNGCLRAIAHASPTHGGDDRLREGRSSARHRFSISAVSRNRGERFAENALPGRLHSLLQ